MRTHLPATLKRARRLRRKMSLPEVLLWRELKIRHGGFKFRKQHPFGHVTADFYCDSAKLVVEVDGEAHNRDNRPENDAARDSMFTSHGIRVLRIAANDVLSNLEGVVRGLVMEAETRESRRAQE